MATRDPLDTLEYTYRMLRSLHCCLSLVNMKRGSSRFVCDALFLMIMIIKNARYWCNFNVHLMEPRQEVRKYNNVVRWCIINDIVHCTKCSQLRSADRNGGIRGIGQIKRERQNTLNCCRTHYNLFVLQAITVIVQRTRCGCLALVDDQILMCCYVVCFLRVRAVVTCLVHENNYHTNVVFPLVRNRNAPTSCTLCGIYWYYLCVSVGQRTGESFRLLGWRERQLRNICTERRRLRHNHEIVRGNSNESPSGETNERTNGMFWNGYRTNWTLPNSTANWRRSCDGVCVYMNKPVVS